MRKISYNFVVDLDTINFFDSFKIVPKNNYSRLNPLSEFSNSLFVSLKYNG